VTSSAPATAVPLWKRLSRKQLTAIAVVAVLVIGGGLAAWLLQRNPLSYSQFTYSQLDSYHLSSRTKGVGMTFQKPIQLQAALPSSDGKSNQILVHDVTVPGGRTITIAYESASVIVNPPGYTDQPGFYTNFNSALGDSSSPSYKTYQASLGQFAQINTNPRYKLSLGKTVKLTTKYIKSNAWIADFSGIDNRSYTNKYTPSLVYGKVAMAVTQKGYYYFLVSNVGSNWQTNQAIWQKVIDSLQLDQ